MTAPCPPTAHLDRARQTGRTVGGPHERKQAPRHEPDEGDTIIRRIPAALAAPVLALGLLGAVAPAASAEAPRPGCGYGDTNHAHQAAPGLDPLDLRPGLGKGDDNRTHTTAPGQAPEDGGDQSGPMRGCKA